MTESQSLNEESSSVQAHLTILQGVIQRMADNSRHCKVWCITLVSASLVLVTRTTNSHHTLVAIVPIVLFLVLDTYYLALERSFRRSYNRFVGKLHEGELRSTDLYAVTSGGPVLKRFFGPSLASFSIWPFYLLVALTVVVAWWLMLSANVSTG